jgi:hypothetical protein
LALSAPDGQERVSARVIGGAGSVGVSDEQARMSVLLSQTPHGGMVAAYTSEGKPAAVMDVQENGGRIGVTSEDGQVRAGLTRDKEGGGLIAAMGEDGGVQTALISHKEGGRITVMGPENTTLVAIAATPDGGKLAIYNDLGILRAMLHVLEEGGRLDIQWAGSPAAVLAANEHGGTLVVLDPEGEIRGSVPEAEDAEEEE